jgi:predicted permease
MSMFRRVANLLRRDRLDREIDEELQSHIDLAVEAGERSGLSSEEARRVARLRFGNALHVRERTLDADIPVVLESGWRDVRHAVRQLRTSPVLSATAVLTLALGIGATTAVYTLIEQVMLRPLPVADTDRLWRVGHSAGCCHETGYAQNDWVFFPHEAYEYFRANTPAFEELTAFQVGKADLAVRRIGAKGAAAQTGQYVSGSFFRTFGVSAAYGRVFTDDDDQPGAPSVAVMSYHTWKTKYGADASVVGSSYEINGKPFTVVGITPPEFFGVKMAVPMPDMWLPLAKEPLLAGETSRLKAPSIAWLDIIGRVHPGTRLDALELQLNGELQAWLRSHASDMTPQEKAQQSHQRLSVTPGGNGISLLQDEYEGALKLLFIAAACVLLIACANVANLLLARGLKDAHQTALRTALGASRFRLIRKALIESIVLSLCGAIAGVAVAYAGAALILRLVFPSTGTWVPVSAAPSLPVLGLALTVSIATGVLFGIAPAWLTTRADPMDAMRGVSRNVRGQRNTSRKALVIVQVALSFVLLSSAAMLARSVRNLERSNLGFESNGRYIASINTFISGYTPDQINPLLEEVERRLREIPGVRATAAALYAPMGGLYWSHDISVDGKTETQSTDGASSAWTRVTPDFFEALGIRIVAGRAITRADNASSRKVAVVNEQFAEQYFGKSNPVGQHFGPGASNNSALYEVIGVVSNIRYFGGGDTDMRPMYFVPQTQGTTFTDDKLQGREVWSHYPYNLVIWAPGPKRMLEPDVKRVIAEVAPDFLVNAVLPYDELIHQRFSQENMIATLSTLFGAISLVLASVGLYGVIAYGVQQRTGEIGVRMALGAQRSTVVAMVLRDALTQVGIGALLGIPAAIAAGSMMANQLFGVVPGDFFLLSITTVLLALAASIAAAVPARRAAAVSPMQVLRD